MLRARAGLRRVADRRVRRRREAKAGLVRGIFGGAARPGVARPGRPTAVGRRWTASRDLADALEHLGVVAVVRSAEQAGRPTARATSCSPFGQLVDGNPELRDALVGPGPLASTTSAALLARLLDGKALPATVALAEQARRRHLPHGRRRAARATSRSRPRRTASAVATVRVARALADADAAAARRRALASQYDRARSTSTSSSTPSVIGGIRVEIGDDVIDGTVASRLDDARRRLAG